VHRRLALALLAPAVFASAAAASVVRVDHEGSGDHLTIQEGIWAAHPGDTVLVAPGTYSGPLNRNLDFGGTDLVLRSDEGPALTVIDCQEAARGFYFATGEGPTSIVEGFTVANGRVVGNGAGACCLGAAPSFVGCRFVGNIAEYGGDVAKGGGIYGEYCSIAIVDCAFDGNGARDGAGVFLRYSTVTVERCDFVANLASSGGGGLRIYYGDGAVTGCTFRANSAVEYGGALCMCHNALAITGCTFVYNGSPDGSAIYGFNTTPTITNTILAFGTEGNAIFCPESEFAVAHCCVFGNPGGDALCGSVHDNLFVDPLLCDAGAEEVWLQDCSPCLGAGADGGDIGARGPGCICGDPTSAADAPEAAARVAVAPNPFVGETAVRFDAPAGAAARVAVHNLRGEVVRTLARERLDRGRHSFTWDGRDEGGRLVPSGVYFVRCEVGSGTSVGKAVLIR